MRRTTDDMKDHDTWPAAGKDMHRSSLMQAYMLSIPHMGGQIHLGRIRLLDSSVTTLRN